MKPTLTTLHSGSKQSGKTSLAEKKGFAQKGKKTTAKKFETMLKSCWNLFELFEFMVVILEWNWSMKGNLKKCI